MHVATYINHMLQQFLPQVWKHLIESLDRAVQFQQSQSQQTQGKHQPQWASYSLPSSLNVRCVEWITYDHGDQLRTHIDLDSVYTVSILTSYTTFDGGQLQVQNVGDGDPSFDSAALEEAGDAVLFLSEAPHRVLPVTHGDREVLVIEFWKHFIPGEKEGEALMFGRPHLDDIPV